MSAPEREVNAAGPAALTPEEVQALALAEQLRDRIRRERETAQLLSAYLEVNSADIEPTA